MNGARAWLNSDAALVPGTELFRSERRFQPWAYSTSHGELLLRSYQGEHGGLRWGTTIDILFKPPHYAVGSPGADPGFTIASAADLLTALAEADEETPTPRTRWRMVHVVMKKVAYPDGDEVTGAGVFPTRSDADDYLAHIRPRVAACWIETLPIAI